MILSQSAVSVCNLVQHTTLSLQYPARTIGIGCLYFVCKEIKCEVCFRRRAPVWRHEQGLMRPASLSGSSLCTSSNPVTLRPDDHTMQACRLMLPTSKPRPHSRFHRDMSDRVKRGLFIR